MDILLKAVQALLNMGAVALLPIMICILGLVFRMKFGASLKAGLMVGIGFQGLSLTVGLLTTTIQPITEYYQKMGSGFTAADIGFAAVGGASWTVPFAPIAVPLIVIANFILLRAGLTKVLNVDIWNYIHLLIPGALAYALWGNALLGLAITVGLSIAALYAGQAIAHHWQDFFGLDGTTCSTLSFTTFMYPLSWAVNKLVDHIPGIKDIDIDMKKLEEKLGFFGDPAFVGLIVGIFLGLLTRQAPTTVFGIGMGIASVLILIPRMVSIMMEGLTPIGNAASAYMKKHMGEDAELFIGMDVALGLGDPACITCTAICIPITILFAFIIPNMVYFPIGLLGIVCYTTVMCVLASKGNLLRSLICSITSMFLITFFVNMFVPECTKMLSVTGLKIQGLVADGSFGYNLGTVIICFISKLFGM